MAHIYFSRGSWIVTDDSAKLVHASIRSYECVEVSSKWLKIAWQKYKLEMLKRGRGAE